MYPSDRKLFSRDFSGHVKTGIAAVDARQGGEALRLVEDAVAALAVVRAGLFALLDGLVDSDADVVCGGMAVEPGQPLFGLPPAHAEEARDISGAFGEIGDAGGDEASDGLLLQIFVSHEWSFRAFGGIGSGDRWRDLCRLPD